MTDQTESDGLDHTRTGVHEGRLLHASPILPATVESASENAELLADLDFYDEDHWRNVMRQYPGAQATIRKAAAAIRALEAKVRGDQHEITSLQMRLQDEKRRSATWQEAREKVSADRDRLAEALAVEQRVAKGWQETAEKFRGERDRLDLEAARLAGEVERLKAGVQIDIKIKSQMSQDLEDFSTQIARLTAELAAAREELAQRREHMRRGITPGRATGGEG